MERKISNEANETNKEPQRASRYSVRTRSGRTQRAAPILLAILKSDETVAGENSLSETEAICNATGALTTGWQQAPDRDAPWTARQLIGPAQRAADLLCCQKPMSLIGSS